MDNYAGARDRVSTKIELVSDGRTTVKRIDTFDEEEEKVIELNIDSN